MPPVAAEYLLTVPVNVSNPREHAKNMSESLALMIMATREATGRAGITQAQLQEVTALSPRTVGTVIRALQKRNIIRAVRPVENP